MENDEQNLKHVSGNVVVMIQHVPTTWQHHLSQKKTAASLILGAVAQDDVQTAKESSPILAVPGLAIVGGFELKQNLEVLGEKMF